MNTKNDKCKLAKEIKAIHRTDAELARTSARFSNDEMARIVTRTFLDTLAALGPRDVPKKLPEQLKKTFARYTMRQKARQVWRKLYNDHCGGS